ncbi:MULTISPECIES: hypothetical protein [Streptomyces]|uniref:Uncharacterized protein n=1 Tax=Streptomyces flaveolus TaxID=67297 RepID=A0ABV3AQ10_9ACTN|nr:hypothetical protein [Streptomyces sp. NRRL F-3307]
MSLSQAEADQIRSGVATRQLVQAARPDLLLLPVQSLLPPPGHHRMGHRESLRRIHPGPPRTPHHTRPPPLRGDHLRHPVHIQVLQRLVGVRVQQPPPVPHAHPPPARQVPHRPHRLPGAPRGAQPAPERGRPHHRARRPPPRLRHTSLPAGADLRIVHGEPRQRPGQHLVPGPAQLGERTPPGLVEDDLRIGAHTAALVPHGGVAACPQPQHARGRQAVTRRRSMDQRRGQLPGQRHDP